MFIHIYGHSIIITYVSCLPGLAWSGNMCDGPATVATDMKTNNNLWRFFDIETSWCTYYHLKWGTTCKGCNMGMGDLSNIYAQSLRATGPRDDGIHMKQITNAHVTSVM